MGEPHLQAPLLAGGVQAEYVEDERRAVDHLHIAADRLLKVRLLRWCELIVEHDEVGRVGARKAGHLLGLAGADEGLGVRGFEPLGGHGHHVRPCSVDKALELGKRGGERPRRTRTVDPDEHGSFAALLGDGHSAARDDGFEFGHRTSFP